MAITINTNVSSLFAQQYLNNNTSKLSDTIGRLSSGLRINSAKDDAAGYAISINMQNTISGLKQGSRNANDGISALQTAEGAMGQITNLLQRMSELASQASNGIYQSSDSANLNAEFTKLRDEIDRVTNTSKFNGVNLLDGSSISIQVGAGSTSNDKLTINLVNTSAATLGVNSLDVGSATNASSAISAIKTALDTVTTGLADLGAYQSNLEKAIDTNNTFSANLQNARSRIMDTDYAQETANLAKFNILNQSNVAMLAQANAAPQLVLQLLRG